MFGNINDSSVYFPLPKHTEYLSKKLSNTYSGATILLSKPQHDQCSLIHL